MIANAAVHQLFEIFILHRGGDALFVIHLFVDVIFRFMSSFGHEYVQFVMTVEVTTYFYPNAKSDQSSEGTVRNGGRKIDANVKRRITAGVENRIG